MKSVSIEDLERNLSGYLERAAKSEVIVVTLRGRPWVKLSAAEEDHVWVGSRMGRVSPGSVLDAPLPQSAWRLIEDDREDSIERPLRP